MTVRLFLVLWASTVLAVASGREVYYKACAGDISPFDAFVCCSKFNIGCSKLGESCSTGGSLIQPPGCERGVTCVISDFGFPAADRPNEGICKKIVGTPPDCSIDICTSTGSKTICIETEGNGLTTTCGAWATRSDGFPGPDCNLICLAICLEDGPVGSDGKKYCSLCYFTGASCESNFEIYGPVSK